MNKSAVQFVNRVLQNYEDNRVFISELNESDLELFYEILKQDGDKAETWYYEGVVNLYSSLGGVQVVN